MKRAFTLIEIVVALGVMSIISVVVFSLMGSGLNIWLQGKARTELSTEVKLLMNMIEEDIASKNSRNIQYDLKASGRLYRYEVGRSLKEHEALICENIKNLEIHFNEEKHFAEIKLEMEGDDQVISKKRRVVIYKADELTDT